MSGPSPNQTADTARIEQIIKHNLATLSNNSVSNLISIEFKFYRGN